MSVFENEFNLDEIVIGTTKPDKAISVDNTQKSTEKNSRWFNSHNGFFMLPRAIREDASLNNHEFRVLVTLGSYVMFKDEATPTLYTLSKQTGLLKGDIENATRSLEKKGWLKIQESDDDKNIYYLLQPEHFKNKPKQE